MDSLTVEGGITGNGGLTITNGNVLFTENLTVEGGITGDGGLTITNGNVLFTENLTVEGGITGDGGLTITNGNVLFTENLTVEGGITGDGGLTITNGNVLFMDSLTVDGNLDVSGSITGDISISDLTVNDNLTVSGSINCAASSNYVTTSISNNGITFCRNLDGNNEFDIVAITEYAENMADTLPILNIFTSYTEVESSLQTNGEDTSNNPNYTLPIVSMNDTTVTVNGAVTCAGTSNYGSTNIGGAGLTFCRNITNGNDEFDIVAINDYGPASTDKLEILNIYTSYTGISSATDPNSTYTPPIVSMNDTTVTVNGDVTISKNLNVTGSITGSNPAIYSFYFSQNETFSVGEIESNNSVSFPYNPTLLNNWDINCVFPQCTLICTSGASIKALSLTQVASTTNPGTFDINISFTFYVYNPITSTTITGVYVTLFYQPT
jgi:hypothetical protein